MLFLKDIKKYIFQKEEINYLWLIFFGIIFTTIMEAFSLSVIVPVFDIIFFNKFPQSLNLFRIIDFNFNLKILVLSLFLLIFLIKNISLILFNYFYINYFHKLSLRISDKLFNLTLNQPYIFFLEPSSNNILQTATEEVKKMGSFFLSLINFIIEVIFILVICALLIFINLKIFLFCFINFSFVIIIYYKIVKNRIMNWSYVNQESTGKVQNIIIEGIRGIKDLIIYKLREYFLNSFNESNINWYRTRSNIDFLNTVQKYWLELIGVVSMTSALLYFVFIEFYINNLIPIFGLYVFAIFRLITSFSRIVHYAQNVKFCYPSYKIILDQLKRFDTYDDEVVNNNVNNNFKFESSLEINNVSFVYSNKFKIFNKINLKIFRGECVCIIGKNGSGKSTLLNLISGLIKPTEGKIIIDDKFDLYSNKISWHEKLSFVQQNIFLVNDTIKKNITLNKSNQIDNFEFAKILKSLKLEEFFKNLPSKLDTLVDNDGLNLSGGQKQIISLARALYKKSEVIILDEPSSALDMINTLLLKKVVLSLKNKKTIIMVTHDKDFFYDCFDKIFEIELGDVKTIFK